jgi:hypothetical protein
MDQRRNGALPRLVDEMTSRKNPGVAFWATVVVVVVLVAYPLSFGPACWWLSPPRIEGPFMISTSDAEPHAPRMYWPFGLLVENGPLPVAEIIEWYGTRRTNVVWLATDWSGESVISIASVRDFPIR